MNNIGIKSTWHKLYEWRVERKPYEKKLYKVEVYEWKVNK